MTAVALGLVADGRALEHVPHVDQQDFLTGGRGPGPDLLDVVGGRGAPAQRRREFGVHEPGRLGRDVAVQVVGPHQVQAQDAVVIGSLVARQAGQSQKPRTRNIINSMTPNRCFISFSLPAGAPAI